MLYWCINIRLSVNHFLVLYVFIAVMTAIAVLLIIRIVTTLSPLDYSLGGFVMDNAFVQGVREISSACRKSRPRGGELPLYNIKKNLARAHKIISQNIAAGAKCYDFELKFYDNYHKLLTELNDLESSMKGFKELPCTDRLPNIYRLCSYIVKASGGAVTEKRFSDGVEAYCLDVPLNADEISMLKACLTFALLEYVSVFAARIATQDKIKQAAKKDAAEGRVNTDYLRYDVYAATVINTDRPEFRRDYAKLVHDGGLDISTRLNEFAVKLSEYSGMIGAATSSLYGMSGWFNDEFTLSLSPTAKYLSGAGGNFDNLTVSTKFSYINALCRTAKKSDKSELSVAHSAVACAARENKDIAFCILPAKLGKSAEIFLRVLSVVIALSCGIIIGFFVPVAGIAAGILFFFVILPLIYELTVAVARYFYPAVDYPQVKITDDIRASAAIICCRFVKTVDEAKDAVKNMQTVMCANRGYGYGLLLDAPEEIRDGIRALYEESSGMFIAVRRQAYERKRGAILQFNDMLISGNQSQFDFVLGGIKDFKYIITLDADSMLADADYLIRVMEHPYAENKNILSLPMRTNPYSVKTPFARLFSGGIGLCRYNCSSDNGDILFGHGNYTGKGIYRTRQFNQLLDGSLPDNRIISHDLIEGAYAGCGSAGISGMDEFPPDYKSFLDRQMRWFRGDVQLMPFLRRKVKNKNGFKTNTPFPSYYKWRMLLNILSPLSSVCALALVILSVFSFSPVLFALAFSREITGMLFALRGIKSGIRNVAAGLFNNIFQIVTLPTYAIAVLCSFGVTLLRLIRRKNLMCWTTFAHARGKNLLFIANYTVGIFLIIMAFFMAHPVWLFVFGGLFLTPHLFDFMLSQKTKPYRLKPESAEFLQTLVKKTWNYYNSMPDFALPPDNECDTKGWADRSSPTDIAMAITAVAAASDMGLIDNKETVRRLRGQIDAVDKLQKLDGLPYNWYRASDGRPLKPRYVSSVDCGNLLAALILASSFECVREKAERLISEMDFTRLYDSRRKLLHIGYNADEKTLDSSYYDLLGSEAVMTYLLCIGCGKLPAESYYSLSDAAFKSDGNCLVSWTGGLFEYTLPLLYLFAPENTLFSVSAKNVVSTHIGRAAAGGEPVWGRSESLFAAINDNSDYSYSAFGQPSIALSNKTMRRVAAPYASVTGIAADIHVADKLYPMLNSFVGGYGLPDAIDFDANKVVGSRMTHHQGMIMAALCIPLAGDSLRRRMETRGETRAAQLHMCLSADPLRGAKRKSLVKEYKPAEERSAYTPHELPQLSYLTNGEYVSVIDENGKGYAMNNGRLLSRFDAPGGIELYACGEDMTAGAECAYFCGTVNYKKKTKGMCFDVTAYVLPDFSAEIREIKIQNTGKNPLPVTFTAAFEPSLKSRMADISHKAYSSLFVTTHDRGGYAVASREIGGEVALALGDKSAVYNGSKQNFLRGTGLAFGSVVFPKLYGSVDIVLEPGQEYKTEVLLIAGDNDIQIKYALTGAQSEAYTKSVHGKVYTLSSGYELIPVFRQLGAYLLYKKGRINGRLPQVLLRAASEEKLSLEIKQLQHLRRYGIEFEVIILYKENYGYKSEISDYVHRVMMAYGQGISAHNETYADKSIIAELKQSGIEPYKLTNGPLLLPQKCRSPRLPNAEMPKRKLDYKLGLGGFTENSYYVQTGAKPTPAPWSNVLAHKDFGCVVTGNGGGFTFGANAYMQKLTPWSGDEFNDKAVEGVILGERGRFWSVTRHPVTRGGCDYAFEHYIGHTRFTCNYNGLLAVQKVYIGGRTKYYDITLYERSGKKRQIDMLFFAHAVLGDFVQNTMGALTFGASDNSVSAANGGLSMTISGSEKMKSYAHFAEAFFSGGKVYRINNLQNSGHTPCLSMSVRAELPAGGHKRILFSLSADGSAFDRAEANEAFAAPKLRYFMTSGEKPYGYYLKWLFVQTYWARFTAKCGFQQVSGAYGFRDQLQDCLSLLYYDPSIVRKHILNAAEHQYLRGDVMHWWHEPRTGVRTKICDDRLYMPLAAAEYIEFTDDKSILYEKAPYLKDIELPENKSSVYAEMALSAKTGTLHEHCMKAILSVEVSDRGLVLIGGGDWNDGMDEVGIKGTGESVWCSMFLFYVIKKYLPYCSDEEKQDLKVLSGILRTAVADCYTGDRYLRAFTDDGAVLGSEISLECKIDLLVQSWAVLSGVAEKQNARAAMRTAYDRLVDEKAGVIKLLDPPYKEMKVGYIAGYPKGVRENGGQYTHAAVWFVRAMYETGDYATAEKLLRMLLPSSHTATQDAVESYRAEPYVLAADIYSGELNGQGGWSWYTGSAGWLYKTIIEYHYGVRISRGSISFAPRMKGKADLIINTEGGSIEVSIDRKNSDDEFTVTTDGITVNAGRYPVKSLVGKKVYIT